MQSERFALLLSIAGNFVVAITGVAFASITESRAILLDGLFNAVFFVMGLVTLRVSRLVEGPPTASYPYGYASFEPLLNAAKGLLVLAVSAAAVIPAVESLFKGGRQMDPGLGAIYAGIAMVICLGVAAVQHRIAKRVESPLVAVDAKNWLVNGAISSAVGVAFLVTTLLRGTSVEPAIPYADPALVVVLVVATLPIPWRMVARGLGELLLVAPPQEVQRAVRARSAEVLAAADLPESFTRVVAVGRWLYVTVHVLVPSSAPARTVAELDRIRAALKEGLAGLHPKLVLDVVFTASREWALSEGEDSGHLRAR